MKKLITLSVENPCSKSFDEFSPTASGGYCQSCSKNVIDFTQMSDIEIVDYFTEKNTSTCGRFHPSQLDRMYSRKNVSLTYRESRWLHASFFSLLLLLAGVEGSAQNVQPKEVAKNIQSKPHDHEQRISEKVGHVIEGIVMDEDKSPLPGVNIYLKGSTDNGTVSDMDGKFKFPTVLEEGEVLVFSFIGFETKEYVVPKEISAGIEVSMIFYNQILGEVVAGEVYTEESSGIAGWWQKLKQKF